MPPDKKHKHAPQHQPQPQDAAKQAHLEIRNEEADLSSRIDKLVSLTYDSDPAVRKTAALELSKIDDPRSIFALLELSSDKNPEIKDLALASLGGFKGEKEAIVNLEKIFEARQEGQGLPQDMAEARQKMLPSIEKLFSNKDPLFKARLLPSILAKYFSSRPLQTNAPPQTQPTVPNLPAQPPKEGIAGHSNLQSAQLGIEKIETDEVKMEAAVSQPSRSLSPKQQGEEAADFPLPEGMRQKTASPIGEIESMMPELPKEFAEEDEALSLHPNRIDFYKWAYALAVDPKMTASKIRSEEKRLISQMKKDIVLAFRLAVARAKTTGIESLSGLKPGMKRVTTFPLLISDRHEAVIMSGKTATAQVRLALTDGKHTVPLYIDTQRAIGISAGDHISLHDAKVDFFVETNELVFLLGKKGYITVTK